MCGMFRPPACNVGQGYTPVVYELFHHADAYKGSPLPIFHIKKGRVTYFGRASKKNGGNFQGARGVLKGSTSLSALPQCSLVPVSLSVGPSPPPSLFSDREHDGSEEEDLDVEAVISVRRVGSFPVISLPQPTLPGKSWLTCLGRLLAEQPRP